MAVPGYIVSVFQATGLCTGSFDYQQLASRLQEQLEKLGLHVNSWEPVHQSGCFAVLIRAEAQAGMRVDLLRARRHLSEQLNPLHLQVRIQREDVFLAMHRL
jgi:predicted amino acid-binding ACT domain protein